MAETIDWVAALSALGRDRAGPPDEVVRTLGAIAKTPDDRQTITDALDDLTREETSMKIDNEFTVSAPIEQAWAVLTDLEGIAPCMPGAVLTGRDGDAYHGQGQDQGRPADLGVRRDRLLRGRRTTRPTTPSSTPRARTRAAPAMPPP